MVKLVGPFAPHLGDESWERLGGQGFLLEAPWPTYDDALTIDERVTVGVQVDGKLRGDVELARDASEDEARAAALADPQRRQAPGGACRSRSSSTRPAASSASSPDPA